MGYIQAVQVEGIKNNMKHLEVVAAILINNSEILCTQRKESKYDYVSFKYEFPGGKVEAGETFEMALTRELKEEMDIDLDVHPDRYFMTVNHEYPDFSITMHAYLCPVEHRNMKLKEHHDHIWLLPSQLDTLDWAPADLPIVKKLMEEFEINE